jgi:hypothetical protein
LFRPLFEIFLIVVLLCVGCRVESLSRIRLVAERFWDTFWYVRCIDRKTIPGRYAFTSAYIGLGARLWQTLATASGDSVESGVVTVMTVLTVVTALIVVTVLTSGDSADSVDSGDSVDECAVVTVLMTVVIVGIVVIVMTVLTRVGKKKSFPTFKFSERFGRRKKGFSE